MGSLVAVEIDPGLTWGEGATFRQIHEEAGMRQVLEGTLLAYAPNERILMRLEHADFSIDSELTFEALGERSRVSQSTRIELRSMALRLARPIVHAAVGKRLADDMDRLKALLESN